MSLVYNYSLFRGDYKQIPFAVTDSNNEAVDLTGVTIIGGWQKQGVGQSPAKAISVGDGITVEDAEAGYLIIGFRHEMEAGIYDYNIQFDFADASIDRQTLISGVCTLYQDVI